jgi:hypothetical protein
MRKYVFMGIDELGDTFRAHGTEFLEGEHSFPDFEEDPQMWEAFLAWENAMIDRANKEWQEICGPESKIFLEEKMESQFRRMGFHGI